MRRARSDYGPWASVYDGLGRLYSGGAIGRAKAWHIDRLVPGCNILYAGAGSGGEALEAARRGAHVTLLDSSPAMLARAESAFATANLPSRFVCSTLERHVQSDGGERFDAVAAHFFLNVFRADELPDVLSGLVQLLAPGGHLWLADFAAPRTNALLNILQQLHYLPPLALFGLVAKNPWHELYDYPACIARTDLPLQFVACHSVRAFGLPLYEALGFRREAQT